MKKIRSRAPCVNAAAALQYAIQDLRRLGKSASNDPLRLAKVAEFIEQCAAELDRAPCLTLAARRSPE